MNRKIFLNIILLLLTLLLSIQTLRAQEVLIDCGNPFLQEYSKKLLHDIKSKPNTRSTTVLELPFFDDFSSSFVYPDSEKWLDKKAFISNGSSIDPISYCAARLDAINEYGYVYPHLSSNGSNIADSLTSRPINLELTKADSVYFSFFYQASGIGNAIPSKKDSLVLQFKTPESDWKSVWQKEGGKPMTKFQNVHIPITEEDYLKKGFQFRFVNYASVSSNYQPSWISNTDYWLLDFIYLDKERSHEDTIANDVAFIKNFTSCFKNYESIPWEHYKKNPNEVEKINTLKYIYKNTWKETQNINRQVIISSVYGSGPSLSLLDDSENILAGEIITYDKGINYDFITDEKDSAKFLIKGFLKTDAVAERAIFRNNDTIRYYQYFNNYYAYDDGTPEKGYGLSGDGSKNASLAYKFNPIVEDSLRGVNIFFNRTLRDGNKKHFLLSVWDDNNGIPGEILYQEDGYKPEFSDSIIGFTYYPLKKALNIKGPFYIGWKKTTEDLLNCGFDINRDAGHNTFYNLGGEWQKTQFEGALMIRPVFGKDPLSISISQIYTEGKDIEIYPNPASNYIQLSDYEDISRIDIYDLSGKLVLSDKMQNSTINISQLKSGVYLIKPISEDKIFNNIKLLISK